MMVRPMLVMYMVPPLTAFGEGRTLLSRARAHSRTRTRAGRRHRGMRRTVFSPGPVGRLVRQSPIGVFRHRRRALLSFGSSAS